jgi:hypothetical protein
MSVQHENSSTEAERWGMASCISVGSVFQGDDVADSHQTKDTAS